MKKILFIIGISVFILGGLWFSITKTRAPEKTHRSITVITTLFPLYDFANVIGGDKVHVTLLLPPGVEAHSFEPKPSDVTAIDNADIFLYTGPFMEPWAEDVIQGFSNKHTVVVNASTGIELMKKDLADHGHHESHHDHAGVDPHIWLDFENDKIIIDTITKAFIKKDPDNALFYQANAEAYKKKLSELDLLYETTLANCQNTTIIYGGHYAFGYLAKQYGLTYRAAQGFSPDSEPTANDLIALVEDIKDNGIPTVFYEELSSPKIAETLAKETNARMVLLHGAHNVTKEDYDKNVTFLSIMEENLKGLALGLECHQ